MPETPEYLTDEYWSRGNVRRRLWKIHGNRAKIEQWNREWAEYLKLLSREQREPPAWSSKDKWLDMESYNLSHYDPDPNKCVGINLSFARLEYAKFIDTHLKHANLSEVHLEHANFQGAYLGDADLDGAYLEHAYLWEAHLEHAHLRGTHLEHASLGNARLEHADLEGARLEHANLWEAHFEDAKLESAHLEHANLMIAHLEHAKLKGAHLEDAKLLEANLKGADLTRADLRNANVTGVIYDRGGMRGKYLGVRGLDSCYGHALFKRDAQDQDYIDILEAWIKSRSMRLKDRRRVGKIKWGLVFSRNHCWRYLSVKAERVKRYRVRPALFRAWGWIDYGRNIEKVAGGAVGLAMMFGIIFWIDWLFGPWMLNYKNAAKGTGTLLTPFYYSIVTYTTLGFGDVTPNNLLGESLVIIEVILGYTTLGLLISILANKVARRA